MSCAPALLGSTLFEQTRERKGGLISLQFKPADNLTLGLEGFSSKLEANNYNRNFMLWGSKIMGDDKDDAGVITARARPRCQAMWSRMAC